MKYFLRSLLIGLLCLAPLSTDATQRTAALISQQAIDVDLGFTQVGNVGNLSIMGAPSGATFSLLTNPGGHFSIVGTEIVAEPSTPTGQYSISVQATGTGFSVHKTFVLNFSGVPPPPGVFSIGGTLSGLEVNSPVIPTSDEIGYLAHKHLTNFRLPLHWGQLNPAIGSSFTPNCFVGIQSVPFGALDTTSTYLGAGGYLGAMDGVIANAATAGETVLIDFHNFGFGPGLAGNFGISSLTASGTTITATTAAAANLVNGAVVIIKGATDTAADGFYNGTFTISNVTSSTFQYTASGTPSSSPATGTVCGIENASVGSVRLPAAAFANLWSQIATHYKTSTTISGYDLMNEPINGFVFSDWFNSAQAAITAIRATGDTHPIYVEGVNFAGAWNWVSGAGQPYNNSTLYLLNDPLNNLIFSAHSYFDRDSSGGHFVWSQEIADPGEAPPGTPTSHTIGTTRLTPFVQWCSQHQLRCHIGETATSNDPLSAGGVGNSTDWNLALADELSFIQANNLQVNIFGGGAEFGPATPLAGYSFNYEPSSVANPNNKDFTTTGLQSTQMVVIDQFSGFSGAQPIAYIIDPPLDGSFNPINRGTIGAASGSFKIRYNGKITSPVTITPTSKLTDGTNGGGTFTPASIVLAAGDNAVATFTYTPSQSATFEISATNSNGWIDPPAVSFTTLTDNFATAAHLRNVYGLSRLYAPYIGPAIRLKRASDNAQQDFFFNPRGDLPRQAIQDWASSRSIAIAKIYDQSPASNHLTTNNIANAPILTLVNAAGYPEVTVTNGGVQQMTATSIANGFGQQSILARMTAGGSSDFISQDIFLSIFNFGFAGKYAVGNNGGGISSSISLGTISSFASVAGTFSNLYSTNNVNSYNNGTLVASGSTAAFTFNPSDAGGFTTFHYFRFGVTTDFVGSWQYAVITYDEFTPTIVGNFATADATYYSTPLPDSLSAVNPTIVGAAARSAVVSKNMTPFVGVTVADGNFGTPTDSVVITLTGTAGGTLSGTGLSGSGPYTMSSASAATTTTQLRALVYANSGTAAQTETMTVAVTSSAGTSASDSNTVVTLINVAVAETPFAAPGGTFTPRNKSGVNISGGEQSYPSSSQFNYAYPGDAELDYWSAAGFGMIRMPTQTRRLQPASYGPLDPAGRTDEPANAYRAFSPGSQTNLLSIKAVLDRARTDGLYVMLDLHNFGGIFDTLTNTNRQLGSDAEANSQFADIWARLATKFKNYDNIVWNIENEPFGMSATDWKTGAVAAINAIAAVTTAQTLYIPGTSFTGGHSWTSSGNAAAWAGYTPPAGVSMIFDMHEYLDSDFSGTHATCAGFGSAPMTNVTTWARANGFTVFIGEIGWTQDVSCPSDATTMMTYFSANNDVYKGYTYWVGGSSLFYGKWDQIGTYAYSAVPDGYPSGPFTDAPQVTIMQSNILNFLLKRDLDPSSNDNDPMWLEKAS